MKFLAHASVVTTFLLSGVLFASTACFAATPAPDVLASINSGTPKEIANMIYLTALKDKSGGRFLFTDKAIEHAVFAASLLTTLSKFDARSHPGDPGPIDFDPVTNSQQPYLKSYSVSVEKEDTQKSIVAATLADADEETPSTGEETIVHYDFVREPTGWKIADIRGEADDIPWSLKEILK